jgi:hypothetical protein
LTYQFKVPTVDTNELLHTNLTVNACDVLHRGGEPSLPFRTARVLLPPDTKVKSVEAIPIGKPTRLPGKWQFDAVPPRLSVKGSSNSVHSTTATNLSVGAGSMQLSLTNQVYPAAKAEMISVQRMGGFEVAVVRLFPVDYRPGAGSVDFYSDISLRLQLLPKPQSSTNNFHLIQTAAMMRRVNTFVDNPEMLKAYEPKSNSVPIYNPPSGNPTIPPRKTSSIDYLLITRTNFVAAFQPLIDRKIADGLSVKVVTMDTIHREFPGVDDPERIRNCIRDAYLHSGLSYVLLGGGTTVVPCRYAFVPMSSDPQASSVPTDLYYACLDGSWDSNGNGLWGESTDGEEGTDVDLLAEVYVGRAPVETLREVDVFVEKTVRYESQIRRGQPRALLAATFLGDYPSGPSQGADLFAPMLSSLDGYELTWLDDRPSKRPRWSGSDALKALNESPQLVFYNGHADPDSLFRLRTPDLKQLTNEQPFLACSVGCSAARFDHGKFWPASFGETLLSGSRYGAFAAVLNSQAGWFDPRNPGRYSGGFQAAFVEELLKKGNNNLGVAHELGREAILAQVERSGLMAARWCYYTVTLLGDPHVPFATPGAVPHALAGTFPHEGVVLD